MGLSTKIGPLGLQPKKISEDIAKETSTEWKGLRITVKLIVQNRQVKIEVVPRASSLIIKVLNEPFRDQKKVKNVKHLGNLSMEAIFDIAKAMQPRSYAIYFTGTVLEILGTAISVGCTVIRKSPKDVVRDIKQNYIDTLPCKEFKNYKERKIEVQENHLKNIHIKSLFD